MPAPNNGDCPYCKAKKSLYFDYVDKKYGKEYWKCSKCKERVLK